LLASDVAIKAPCRAATTANLTLSGLQTVDGIVLAANDRVLVKNQTSGVNNGIYLASTGAWTRTADADGNRDIVDGTLVLVRLGTASALALYECSCATSPAVIGTTSLAFNLVSVVVGNAGSFTTLTASGQITSSLATGTAPFVIASTTKVANLNVDLLDGADWSAPGAIGGVTPGAGTFSTVTSTGAIAATGQVSGATGKVTTTTGVGNATPAASGAGVSFPATQSASTDPNTMDDYEEGTWTPSVGGTATYLTQVGRYTKIGRLVFIHCHVTINAIGTGSTTVISGLPFGSAIDGPLAVSGQANLATAVVFLVGIVSSGGGTTITISSRVAANVAEGASAIFGNLANIEVSGSYETT
jgi:hypothetical protein